MALKTLKVPFGEMKGLMQAVDDNLLSLSYSPDCQNIDVSEGILSTRKGSVVNYTYAGLPNGLIKRIFYVALNRVNVMIVAIWDSGTSSYKWFTRATSSWVEIQDISGNSLNFNPTLANYIIAPISGSDCMIIVNSGTPVKIMHNSSTGIYSYASLGGTPPNADYITWHRDRIWLAKGNINTVYYSAAFNPEDWSTAGEAGNIIIESYDGDTIQNMANIFDDVLIFKRDSIKKILGDIPSEYAVTDVYAIQGLKTSQGLAFNGNSCFYAAYDGIYQYDGNTAQPILKDEIKDIYSNQYCLMRLYGTELYICNTLISKIIVFDTIKKETRVIKVNSIEDITINKTSDLLFYTNSASIYAFAKAITLLDGQTYIAAYWNTPETDLGHPNAEKTITDMYFNAWGTDSAGTGVGQVKITATYKGMNGVQKTKEKIVTLSTTRKQHDVRLGITGRLFKFKFENVNGSAINLSGITLVCELAED